MSKVQRLIFVDTETTGLDPELHEVIEIAFVMADIRDGRLIVVDTWESKIKPEALERADPRALAVNGYCDEDWQDAPEAYHVWRSAWYRVQDKRAMLCGHNVGFDVRFMIEAWKRHGHGRPAFDYRTIDTYAYALPYLIDGRVDSISLSKVCEAIGIKTGRAHSAMADALASFELARRAMKAMRPPWWVRVGRWFTKRR
jgi:DNA polymerase-3 subunit epsilon